MMAIGIDPGQDGAIVLHDTGTQNIRGYVMPLHGPKEINGAAVRDILVQVAANSGGVLVVLEKVGVMPKQGAVSGFTFGKGVGVIIGVLECIGIPFVQVTPQAWKKRILAGTDRSKDAAILFVERRFPQLDLIPQGRRKLHDGLADAACMALYAAEVRR